MFHPRGQTNRFQDFLDAALALCGIKATVTQGHIDIVEQVEVGDQVKALEYETDFFITYR